MVTDSEPAGEPRPTSRAGPGGPGPAELTRKSRRLAEFEVSMDSDWYGHFVRLSNILMKSDKSLTKRTGQSLRPDGQQVLAQGHECGSAMIDTLHDYVVRSQ